MPEREKIIRIIDELIFEAQKEPTWKVENALRCLKKELLKEQEAVKPKSKTRHGEYPQIVHRCGNCNEILYRHYKHCPSCGRKVKWDDTN